MTIVLAALLGYLLGAIPFGLVIGRLTRGIDLRDFGSHRTGATNALRTLGARWAALVFILDVAKGVAAVLVARAAFGAARDHDNGVAGGVRSLFAERLAAIDPWLSATRTGGFV